MASRRGFFRLLLNETVSLTEEVRGKSQMRLNELAHLPDSVLRQVRPVLHHEPFYTLEEQRVLLKRQPNQPLQELCHLTNAERSMLVYFDGQHPLAEISRLIAQASQQDENATYQQLKKLFFLLAQYCICFPAQAVLEMQTERER